MTKKEEVLEIPFSNRRFLKIARPYSRYIYIYILYIFIVVDEIEESAKKKTKAELNKTKGSKRDGRPRGGWRARVCATVSERGLFKEATCVRETRELVCRLPTDKSVARAFFNCVPPTPAPCPPPFNSSPTDTFHVAPLFLSFFYFFFSFSSFLNLFYRNIARLIPRTWAYRRSRNRAGSTDSRSKGKKGKNVSSRDREGEG